MKYLELLLIVIGSVACVYEKCTQNGAFAMTFDGGPSTKNTENLLQTLKLHGVKATFHVNIQMASTEGFEEAVKKIQSHGHLVGVFISEDYTKFNKKEIQEDVRNKLSVIKEITNKTPRYVRLSYDLNLNTDVTGAIEEMNLVITKLNLDSGDYGKNGTPSTKEEIVAVFSKAMRIKNPHSHSFISCQQDLLDNSVEAVPEIIAQIKKYNYKLCRIDVCVGEVKGELKEITGGENGKGPAEQNNAESGGVMKISKSTIGVMFGVLAMFNLLIM